MDPVSQGVVGAAAAMLVSGRKDLRFAALAGCLGGMAPDLDILIRSQTDPLLHLEFHRQFTHSIFFIPFGSFIVAALLWFIFMAKRGKTFISTYLYVAAGFATHALLDALTTYGTQLLWPFTRMRVAWDFMSIVDPLVTIPLIIGVGVSCWLLRRRWIHIASVFFVLYVCFGAWQNDRAYNALENMVAERGGNIERMRVMPTLGNQFIWRTMYQDNGRYYVDAVHLSFFEDVKWYEGTSIAMLDRNKVSSSVPCLQSVDLQRFDWFTNGWLIEFPNRENAVGDLRYSVAMKGITPMWGIEFNDDPTKHVEFIKNDIDSRVPFEPWKLILGIE